MKITVLTVMYNEEVLAPLFVKHYEYADKIIVLLDADTNDSTLRHLWHPKVQVKLFKFPDMMDDRIKVDMLNKEAKKIEDGWLFVVDADELIFPHAFEDAPAMLKRQTGNVMFARMWQVYRHAGDENIDTTKPPIFQRRHGDSDRETRPNSTYCKPIIIKMPLDFHLTPGNHQLAGKGVVYCNESFDGAHWMMADPDFAVKRRLADRRHRQSKANIRNGFTVQHHNVTEAQIRDICRQHANDPQLF